MTHCIVDVNVPAVHFSELWLFSRQGVEMVMNEHWDSLLKLVCLLKEKGLV